MIDPIKVLEGASSVHPMSNLNAADLVHRSMPHLLRLVRAMEAENAMLRSFSGIVEFPPNRKRIEEHKAYTDQARAALAEAVEKKP